VNIDSAVCGLSTSQENSQDISLLEQCSDDDEDQFRKRGRTFETPEISSRQNIANPKTIILNLGWQNFSKK
jgi:hypothetical protein